MKYGMAGLVVVLVALLAFAPAASAQTKSVRGTVVSAAGDTLVVKVAGKDMSFKIDKTTELTARGAGKAQRAAEAAGAPGVKFTDFVKAGEGVEVTYKEAAGVMTATAVHAGLPAAGDKAPAAEAPGGSAKGPITAVSGSSITVQTGTAAETFAVDSKTLVLGQGLGTITRKFKEEGKAPTVTDLLGVNDQVSVTYKEEGGAKRATEIRVTQKALKK